MATFAVPPVATEADTELHNATPASPVPPPAGSHSTLQVIRRNGGYSPFDASKIAVAVTKAFVAVEGAQATGSRRIHEAVEALTASVVEALTRRASSGATPRALHIEDIQDQVELALMRAGEHKVARAYILYRQERTEARRKRDDVETPAAPRLHVRLADGRSEPLDEAAIERAVAEACRGLDGVAAADVMKEVRRNLYDGILPKELGLAQTMAARTLVEQDPGYAYVSARLLLNILVDEALEFVLPQATAGARSQQANRSLSYTEYFPAFVRRGVELNMLDRELAAYDLQRLSAALKPERDRLFQFLGLQTLYDRYFLHSGGIRYELPQAFFMRVAMGLASREIDREARAIEFYELLSSFDFMCSTPTLFNSGTSASAAFSSCFLTTIDDDLAAIFKASQRQRAAQQVCRRAG